MGPPGTHGSQDKKFQKAFILRFFFYTRPYFKFKIFFFMSSKGPILGHMGPMGPQTKKFKNPLFFVFLLYISVF